MEPLWVASAILSVEEDQKRFSSMYRMYKIPINIIMVADIFCGTTTYICCHNIIYMEPQNKTPIVMRQVAHDLILPTTWKHDPYQFHPSRKNWLNELPSINKRKILCHDICRILLTINIEEIHESIMTFGKW